MKRVLALIGLIMVGTMLIADPNSGVVAVTALASTTSTPQPTTTTAPPDPGGTDPDDSTTTTTEIVTTTTMLATGTDGVYIGEAVFSRFGDFQVEITVQDGLMTSIATLQEPSDSKSARINDQVISIYTEQVLELQSSDFDAITGATVTWESWGASLDSALVQAGLA